MELKECSSELRPFKTAETIEGQTQSVLLYAGLPNYAEKERESAKMNMLDGVAAEAARTAEALTLLEGGDVDADKMEIDSSTKRNVNVRRDRL